MRYDYDDPFYDIACLESLLLSLYGHLSIRICKEVAYPVRKSLTSYNDCPPQPDRLTRKIVFN